MQVFCKKLKKDAEGFEQAPYPGPIGDRIQSSISKEAWRQWMQQQTMLINENHLVLTDKAARRFLEAEMQKFLFSDNYTPPKGYVPPKSD